MIANNPFNSEKSCWIRNMEGVKMTLLLFFSWKSSESHWNYWSIQRTALDRMNNWITAFSGPVMVWFSFISFPFCGSTGQNSSTGMRSVIALQTISGYQQRNLLGARDFVLSPSLAWFSEIPLPKLFKHSAWCPSKGYSRWCNWYENLELITVLSDTWKIQRKKWRRRDD